MKKKVYISGAIAHYGMEERRATFEAAALRLKEQGFEPVNPFENGVPADAHWMAHMKADIALLVGCDYIYMLNGWELSKGAKIAGFLVIFTISMGVTAFIIIRPKLKMLKEARAKNSEKS